MQYIIKHYDITKNNDCRFTLGTEGIKTLFVIGLNPSTANDKKADLTITKIMGFAEQNNFDSFIMLNLYPERTAHPNKLQLQLDDKLHKENIEHIVRILSSKNKATILAAWGEKIHLRQYLSGCLNDIYKFANKYDSVWLKIGNLTKSGHPRHPSRVSYSCELTSFDITNYINLLTDKNASRQQRQHMHKDG